ncbi:MAG TPA: molybdenum cofactor guanylyltransferase [Firmicutes bacterium]|nr:molybdenum cofactor guanylyltransferase [Bacillota bacterium]
MSYYRQGAIVLAGGDSRRIGQPKTLLKLNGETLLERVISLLKPCFSQITLVTDCGHLYEHLAVNITRDLFTGQNKNPLRGIHAGLLASTLPCQFVVACDMPFLNIDLIKYMGLAALEYDVVVPKVGPYYQPLHAYYSRACIKIVERQMLNRDFKITNFYSQLNIRTVGLNEITKFDPDQSSFFNVNTWDDFYRAKEKLAKKTKSGISGDLARNLKR